MSVGHLTELRADMSLSAMHISLVRTGPSWRTRAYLRNICTRSLRCRIVHVMPYGVPFSAIEWIWYSLCRDDSRGNDGACEWYSVARAAPHKAEVERRGGRRFSNFYSGAVSKRGAACMAVQSRPYRRARETAWRAASCCARAAVSGRWRQWAAVMNTASGAATMLMLTLKMTSMRELRPRPPRALLAALTSTAWRAARAASAPMDVGGMASWQKLQRQKGRAESVVGAEQTQALREQPGWAQQNRAFDWHHQIRWQTSG
eukprot:6179042-Pleurochrysis_carterae.AAC.1